MKRLMFFLLAALIGFAAANAQVTQGRVGNGDITIYGTDWTDVYGLDFDNDGTLEFRISDFDGGGWDPSITNGYLSYDWTDGGNNIASQTDYVEFVASGVTIGASSEFGGYGDGMIESSALTAGTYYLGFRFVLNDGVHYGYAECTVVENGTDFDITWNNCYYNATVSGSIITGETGGGSGVDPCLKSIPFTENFEGISSGLPECWSQIASYESRAKWNFSASGHTGNCVYFDDWYGENSRLILPAVDCSSLAGGAQMSFYFKNPITSNSVNITYDVYYRTSSTGDWTIISDASVTDANADWTIAEFSLPSSANTPYYQVSILATGADTYSPKPTLYIDDIEISAPSSCPRPSGLTSTPTDNSLALSWTENGTATAWQVKIGDGEWIDVNTTPSYNATGLNANTEYTISLRANCGGEQSGEITGTFRTICSAETVPYTEDFESLTAGIPTCWEQEATNEGRSKWEYTGSGHEGNGIAFSDYWAESSRLILPVVDCSSLANGAQLTFFYKNPTSGGYNASASLYYRTSSTGEWTAISAWSLTDATNYWTEAEVALPNSSNAAYYQLSFYTTGVNASSKVWIYLDDIHIEAASDCQRPVSGSIDNVSITTADVEWDSVDGATEYKVAYGTTNDPEAATVVTSATNTKTLEGLHTATTYYVWVATVCGASQSTWRSVGNFTTDIACAQVIDAEVTNTASTAIALGWAIDTTVGYASTAVEVAYKEDGATEWITDITTENYYVFAGLTEGATYNFRITNICGTDSAFALELDASTAVCGELSGGSTVSYMPSRPYYGYSYSQAIYPASEVESFGDISGMSFYFNGTPSTRTVDVYITDMDDPSLANGFIDISEFTPVATDYSWSIASSDWSEITFDAPFSHQSGKSIVIALYDKTGSYAGTYSDGFRCHSGSGRYMHNDYSTYDLADPDDGTSATVVPNIRFNTTCNTTCQAPIVVLASVAQHEATVVWTPLGTETSWVAEYRVFGESNWTVAEDEITGTSTYTFANLLAGTHYEFRIGAICGEDRAYGNVTTYTECDLVDVPYIEDFNSGELNHCWVVGTNAPYINEGRLYNYYYTDGFAILPQFSSPINTLRINFDAEYTGYSTGTVQVGVVSDNSGIESFELVETLTLTTDLVRYEVLFSNYTGTGNNIAIKLPVGYVYIDSLVVSPIPSCLAPTALTIDATTPTTADISWTHDATNFEIRYRAAGGEWQTTTSETTSVSLTGLTPETTYEVAVRAICTSSDSSETLTGTFTTEIACAQVTGLAMTAATINSLTIGWGINANIGYASTAVQVSYKESDASEWTDTITTSNTFTLEGLAEGTSYDFRVRNICGNDSANYVALTASTKVCGEVADGSSTSLYIPTYVYYKYSYSQAVYTDAEVGDIDTIRGISYYYNGTNSPSRTIDVYIADVSNASLTGGCLDISQFTQVNTTYIWEVTNGWSEIVFDNEFVHQSGNDIVIAIDDNSGTDNGYNSFRGHSGSGYSYYQDGGNIDPLSPSANSSGARTAVADIRFTTNCGSAEQSATCDVPTSLAASNVTSNSATFSWNGIATQYEIEINGQTPVAATSPYNAQSLTAATAYSVRVRALCDGGLSSDWTDAVTFTTLDEGQQPTTCETPTGLAVNDITENSAVISWNDVELPATDEGFVGEWSLTMANNAQIHRTVTLDATLHTMLGYVGRDMDDVDEDASLADAPMPVTIEQGVGDQMNVSGSFSVELMTGLDPITFDFATTGTLSTNGLSIDPADLTQSITLMGLMPVNLTGTVTFVQPTALPENGVLTLEIASLDVDGSGTYMGGTATMSIDGTNLQASGAKEVTTSEYPKYELVITNTGTNTETAVSDATSPYTAENLTASTAYTVKVRTLCDENTTSDWSTAVPFTTLDSQQPETCDVPTDVTASNVTENSATITWTGNAPQYEVEINGQTTTVSTNSYNAQGLTASTTYEVLVRALCNGGQTSEWTIAVYFITLDEGQQLTTCETPTGLAVSNITENSAVISWNDVELPATDDGFVGEWSLTMANNAQIHRTVTLDATLHTMLGYVGRDMDDIDEDASIANAPMPVTIEQGVGDQMNVSGSFSVELMTGLDPITFDFTTTGTVTANGLSIEPADLTQSITLMGMMPVNLTGTTTFVQPTALPENGILTLEIASLDVDGSGTYMGGTATMSIDGTSLQASGTKEATTSEYPKYELVITNAGTNTETAVSDATSPYTAENLTASTAYTVKVRTLCDENTTSDWSAAVPFTTLDSQQPETCDVPTNLAANNVTENSAIISWTGNAPQYEVEINGQTTTVSTNSYNTQGLTAATTYSVRVRALCDNGLTSNWTTAISFTTLNGGDEPEPCATPVNVTVVNITTNSAVVSWSAGSTTETFDGEWNLELAETDSVHMVITPDQGMHTMLQIAGYDIDDVDENVSVAGTMVPVTIEPSTGNQMNISGSFDMDMYGVDEPVTFHFATTGTVSNNTLTIAPANINETVLIMGAMPIDYTGTVTFVQPTALPVGGNLTIGIASLDISGYGDTTVAMGAYTMTGSVTISMTGSNLTATGPRVGETNDNQNYELVVTNTATGAETTVNPATSPYTIQTLTAATNYTVKVRAICDANSTSDWTSPVPFITLDEGQQPETCDAPTGLEVASVTDSTAVISWNGSASQYMVELNGQTITVSASPYTASGLTPATAYSVRVRALCDNGLTSNWTSTVSFTTTNSGGQQTDTCDIPDLLAASNVTDSTALISWVGTASQYEVEINGQSVTVSTNTYNAQGLTPATTYTVRVRALCDGGLISDWCNTITFTTTDNGGQQQGIDEVNASYSVSVYPNPATNNVTVSVEGLNGKAQLSVIDMSGRTVMSITMEDSNVQLNVSTLAQGTYFVRIQGENISTVRKLIVK